jgi:transcriptional regulator with XRE-family HTH domain
MRRTVVDPRFSALLTSLMAARGVSQRALARQAYLSPSYVSEILSGHKTPSAEVAKAIDDTLGADGRLAALVGLAGTDDDLDRIAAVASRPRQISDSAISSMCAVLRAQRYLDDTMGSASLVAPVLAQMEVITRTVPETSGDKRQRLLYVAAQWAEFAGWLHISTGRWPEARSWLGTALEWANEHGDRDLIATVVSYQGHLAWLRVDWRASIGLARAAMRDPLVYPGQRAYDAYAAARALATVGELDEADRAADGAAGIVAEIGGWAGPVPPWQYYRDPWLWQLERGLVDLSAARWDRARATPAVLALRDGLAAVPEEMRGADWTAEYMTSLASAYMYAGALESAAEVVDGARGIAEATGSGRVLRLVAQQASRLEGLRRGH